MATSVEKILLVRTSALGDVIHTLPALEALRELHPAARISWLVEPAGAQILQGHPALDRVIVLDRPSWKRRARRIGAWPSLLRDLWRLARELRRERFDLVIDFQGNLRSAAASLLAGGRARAGFSRGDVAEWGAHLVTGRKAPPSPRGIHKVEKYLHLVRSLGWQGAGTPAARITVPPALTGWAGEVVASLPGSGPLVILHPAVSRFGEFKRWPVDRYRALADLLRARLDARILITWGPGEEETARAIDRPYISPPTPSVSPPTESPLHLAALILRASVLVAADTAALHLAGALGVPTVGLYGPKEARIYGPRPGTSPAATIQSPAPCSPCRLRRCEHRICMSLIFPEEVAATVARVTGSRTSPAPR